MQDQEGCPIQSAVSVLGGKWKSGILFRLAQGTYRFGELKRLMPWISEKVLVRQLKELERDGVVQRMDYGEMPPRVEYSLTAYGHTLQPVLDHIAAWGREHLKRRASGA